MTQPTAQIAPGRSGRYVNQPTGYRAFIPARLPPEPAVRLEKGRKVTPPVRSLVRHGGGTQSQVVETRGDFAGGPGDSA